jgi:hypothetical protein
MGDSGIDWGTCSGGGTCVAVRKGCCDPCGMPEVDSFAGVNVAHVEVFKAETCPVPMPCPKCPTIVNPNIAARCVNNRCQAFDVGKVPEFSACSFDSDCRLRGGLACCEPCSSDLWVALNVSSEMALRSAVCNGPIACPPCIPIPPAGMRPVCKTGYCAVEPPCSLAPRIGCCFSDTHCAIGRCYAAAACTAGSEGMCKVRANQNECWGDRDCGPG